MNQLAIDFVSAYERRDTGMQRATDRVEREAPGWTEQAIEALRKFAAEADEPFIMEQARAVIGPQLPQPKELRSWGSVTQTAIKRGILVPTGRTQIAASSNGSPKPEYRAGKGCI
jgi:hypothetical protein